MVYDVEASIESVVSGCVFSHSARSDVLVITRRLLSAAFISAHATALAARYASGSHMSQRSNHKITLCITHTPQFLLFLLRQGVEHLSKTLLLRLPSEESE